MDFFKCLLDENRWNEFLLSRTDSFYISKKEEKIFNDYVNNKKYLPLVNQIIHNEFDFSIPKKICMDKIGKKKKRVVYKYNRNESILLKYINFLTYDWRNLITNKPIQNSAGLLCIHQILVYCSWNSKCLLNCIF